MTIPDPREIVERLARKRDRVHPSNRHPDTPLMVKMTFGELDHLLTLQKRNEELEGLVRDIVNFVPKRGIRIYSDDELIRKARSLSIREGDR